MSAHWYWDWDWQRDKGPGTRQANRNDSGQERVKDNGEENVAAPPANAAAPATAAAAVQHHPPHQAKDDVPIKKDLGNKPCKKLAIFISNTKPDENAPPPPPDQIHTWKLFRLREVNQMGIE